MKIVLIFVAFLAFSLAKDEDDKIYENYLDQFKIRGSRNTANDEKLKQNVLKKRREVDEHNARYRKGEEHFYSELNELSWKDDEEIRATNLGFVEGPSSNQSENLLASRVGRAALPDYFNWADKGVVRPVQNQGNCGSCYAFAAIGAIEAQACINFGQCAKLSEQEAMECTNLCVGGWDDWVYNYAYSKTGCTSSSYSYFQAKREECSAADTRARVSTTKVTGWYNLHGQGVEMIKQYLVSTGPMFVAFDVYNNFYSYAGGIYDRISGNYLGGHAVLLTGYGTENDIPYWILKNSWAASWGEKGYFRVRSGINLCRIETLRVSVPIVA